MLKLEAALLLLPCVTALIYQENEGWAYLGVAVGAYLIGKLLSFRKPDNKMLFAKEGFALVAFCWIVLSLVGALPLRICGDIPHYIDALFETISGFTTTGASALTEVESLSHASLLWRSFTHWVGGMGVIVLLMAILPMSGSYNLHLMRAESPGPQVGKLVPKIRDTAKILYIIYSGLTVLMIILLLIVGMPFFDAICDAFGAAGTGGFAIKNAGFAGYSVPIQVITTVFMILFGVNFNAYYFLLAKRSNWKDAFKMEEVRVYFAVILIAIVSITVNIYNLCDGLGDALNKAGFQVGSIITTTGYATADFNLWPAFSKTVLVCLMFMGACAGSTGGGIKVSRIMLMFKSACQEVLRFVHPRAVYTVKMDGKVVDKNSLHSVNLYLLTYVGVFVLSLILITVDNFDTTTNFTAVAATLNNIGPGLNIVGPMGNYSSFSYFSKIVLMLDMLIGRLELYPMLILLVPSTWGRNRKESKTS